MAGVRWESGKRDGIRGVTVVAMMGLVVRFVGLVMCLGYRSRREHQRKNPRENCGAYRVSQPLRT
jgi:hypothetical protein